MRLMTTPVFKFDELSKEAQREVIEKNRDINTDIPDWYEYTMDEWKAKLAKEGFMDANIHFSGFSSQGDGACFDAACDGSRLADAVYSGKDEGFFREVMKLFTDNGPSIAISIYKNSYGNHYSHANTRYINIDSSSLYYTTENGLETIEHVTKILNADITEVPTMISTYDGGDTVLSGLVALRLKYRAPAMALDDLIKMFEKDVNELRKDLSNSIYQELEKEYDSLISDESVAETIIINEYEFTKNGVMV